MGVAYAQRQPVLFLPPPPKNPPPRDLVTPPSSSPFRASRQRRVARDADRSCDSVDLDLSRDGWSPSPWHHVTSADHPRRGLYSPHAMSEPGCATASSDVRPATDDVMASARGGSFDLGDMRHYGDAVADGVLLVDQSALVHHEFSPPSPAPQDALNYAHSSAHIDR